MTTISVKHVWVGATPLESAAYARGTVVSMTGNALFLNPDVPLNDITQAALRLEHAWASRKNGPSAAEELKLATADMAAKNTAQADYVERIAKGDVATIVSAGMTTTSLDRAAPSLPEVPQQPKLIPGVGGHLKVILSAVAGAKSYCYAVFTDEHVPIDIVNEDLIIPPKSGIIIRPSATCSEEFSGFQPGKQVSVQVLAINSAGYSHWSMPATTYIL
jgi:hypothetical protein